MTVISNCLDPFLIELIKQWSAKEKKNVQIDRPNAIKVYKMVMGGVDQLDSGVANYRIKINIQEVVVVSLHKQYQNTVSGCLESIEACQSRCKRTSASYQSSDSLFPDIRNYRVTNLFNQ